MVDPAYKYFVLLGFMSYWIPAIYMAAKRWGGRRKTFSLLAATSRKTYTLFATAVTLETFFYLIFVFNWFIPEFNMTKLFSFLITIILLGHYATGVVPETKGLSKWIHRKVSYGVAWLFLLALIMVALNSSIPTSARLVAALYLIIDSGIWFRFFTQPVKNQEDIIGQAVYISSLPITLIVATYIR